MHVLSMVQQHHGKQLSFNNLLDLDAARNLVREFAGRRCVIDNCRERAPSGVSIGERCPPNA